MSKGRRERQPRGLRGCGVGLEVWGWVIGWGPCPGQSTPQAHPAFVDVSRCGLHQEPWLGCPRPSPAFTLHAERLCPMPHPVTCRGRLAPTPVPVTLVIGFPAEPKDPILPPSLSRRCPGDTAASRSASLGASCKPRDLGQRAPGRGARRPGFQSQPSMYPLQDVGLPLPS